MTMQRCVLAARMPRGDAAGESSGDACREVRALWVRVLIQLRQLGDACSRPESQQRLRRIGVRRPDALVDGLAGEFQRTHQTSAMGCCPPPSIEHLVPLETLVVVETLVPVEAFAPDEAPAWDGGLDRDFEALGATYARLLDRLAPPAGSHRHTWLESRVRVHQARAEALRRAL
ncbi:hypothetical protein ACQ86G_25830 [Roseateles chitinivorans]|uniref:hypothetical protein n=1 Tax=Roseateles chitinivorans TaxID=2917965 RepID=UPI003D674C15